MDSAPSRQVVNNVSFL